MVIALNATRSMVTFFSARRFSRASSRCQEIASPSRSGSVARTRRSDSFRASAMALTRLADAVSTSQAIAKSSSGLTDPSLLGRSRTCPKLARTMKSEPRYLLMVFALAGDSTTTTFIRFCSGKIGCDRASVKARESVRAVSLCQPGGALGRFYHGSGRGLAGGRWGYDGGKRGRACGGRYVPGATVKQGWSCAASRLHKLSA